MSWYQCVKTMNYFIAGLNEQNLARAIAGATKGMLLKREISFFTGGELKLKLEDKNLRSGTVYIVQSIFANANDRLMELFLLADAIRSLGCKDIRAIIPYFGYARQDKVSNGEASSFQCVVRLIKASGIKEIISVDLHNPDAIKRLDLPMVNLATTEVFTKVVKDKKNAVIVAPDAGATDRARALAKALGAQLILVRKERVGPKVRILEIPQVKAISGRNCYLMDDIIDTGNTICAVAAKLAKFSPKSISALASHGLFGNGALQAIKKSCIQKIYVTNSVKQDKCQKVYVLNLGSIISNYIKNSEA